MKTKIPGGSPSEIYGGIFFLTESRRENTRVGKIPAGSRCNRDSWQDPGEGEDSRWESRRDLWRDFFPDGILAGKYPGWQDPGGISVGIGILGGISPRSRWLFYKGVLGIGKFVRRRAFIFRFFQSCPLPASSDEVFLNLSSFACIYFHGKSCSYKI